MSRSAGAGTFFKFQSALTLHMPSITAAFPEVPWAFVYRDPVQVLVSHLGEGGELLKGRVAGQKPGCARSRMSPSPQLREAAELAGYGGKPSQMSDEDFCAAHLASMCREALRAAGRGGGLLLSYEGVAAAVADELLPHFGVAGEARRPSGTLPALFSHTHTLAQSGRSSAPGWRR